MILDWYFFSHAFKIFNLIQKFVMPRRCFHRKLIMNWEFKIEFWTIQIIFYLSSKRSSKTGYQKGFKDPWWKKKWTYFESRKILPLQSIGPKLISLKGLWDEILFLWLGKREMRNKKDLTQLFDFFEINFCLK